ncbi:hypothetical protein [Luteibacter sp.]|uniref:hypothetical protein n=1 Tax=Luteibacter sp. TaxID=1886636 RepID=UPI003F7FE48F
MVTFSVRCTDQSASDCLKTVDVDIGVPELTPAQLSEIFKGAPLRPPAKEPEAAKLMVDSTFFVPVSLDDTVCEACSRDRSSEIPDLD